jgi:hypothetical protein
VQGDDWEGAIERAIPMDGGAARARAVERWSVAAVFPRWLEAIRLALV